MSNALTLGTLIFDTECEQEDLPVRGNLTCSDEPERDKQDEDEVLARLDRADIYAWCSIKVTARLVGFPFQGREYLGGCSFGENVSFTEIEELAKEHGMYEEAAERLREEIRRSVIEANGALVALQKM